MDIRKTWLFTRPIAHRGLHNAEYPENSLGAFKNAIDKGFPIELDVRLTDDGTVVVFHDEKLSRMTKKDGYISKLNASELKNIQLIDLNGKPTEWKIPTLEEVLELVGGAVPILIETKNEAACGALEEKVIDMIKGYKGEVAVQSFSPYSLECFKEKIFEIPRGQLSAIFKKKELSGFIKRYMLTRLKLNHISVPDFISYKFTDLPNKWLTKTKLPVLAWTIRSKEDLQKAAPYFDNFIFENFIPNQEQDKNN